MTGANNQPADDADELRELAHLAAAVGHHVINAFSAAVSNAELIRTPGSARTDPAELATLGTAIVETALDASHVTRRLIDWARRFTTVDAEFTGRPPETVDLIRLVQGVIESSGAGQAAAWTSSKNWPRSRRFPEIPVSFGRCS